MKLKGGSVLAALTQSLDDWHIRGNMYQMIH